MDYIGEKLAKERQKSLKKIIDDRSASKNAQRIADE